MKRIVLILIAIFFFTALSFAQEKKELKIEFQDIPPKYLTNSDGSYYGLCYEIMKVIEKKSGYAFIYPKAVFPIKRIQTDLENGSEDIQLGLTRTPERERWRKGRRIKLDQAVLGQRKSADLPQSRLDLRIETPGFQGQV